MKTILAAVDGSPSAVPVLRTAGELARATDSRLILFRAANLPVETLNSSPSSDERRFGERVRDEALALLHAQRRDSGLAHAEVRVEVGPAVSRICEAAHALDADVIVIGAVGLGGGQEGLGSVTRGVLRDSGRSVFVVRPALL